MGFPGLLNQRRQLILSAVVQEYVGTAEPVSSRSLVEKYYLGISSATVRNEMAALEEEGYLAQPHTSAGRVPTELGYRYYVDSLMERQALTSVEEHSIGHLFEALHQEVEDLLRETSSLLSRLTRYTAVVVSPLKRTPAVLKHLDLVLLGSTVLLAVSITSDGEVRKQAVTLERPLGRVDVAALQRTLDRAISSLDLAGARGRLAELILREPEDSRRLALEKLATILPQLVTGEREAQVFVEGAAHILEQPEFSAFAKCRHIFTALEERYRLMNLLQDLVSASQVVVKIGSELSEFSADISFVGANFQAGRAGTGTLGILGPTRMDYSRAVTAVEQVAGNLSRLLSTR